MLRPARLIALATALSIAMPSIAEAQQSPAPETRQLKFSPVLDGVLIGGGALAFFVPEIFKSSFAPSACRWCHPMTTGGEVNVNGFDRSVRNAGAGALGITPPTWARTSDIITFGVLPLTAISMDFFIANDATFNKNMAVDLGVVSEGVLLAAALNQTVKMLVGRQRPFVAYDSQYASSLRHGTETVADDNLSFYSGHASAAMSVTMGMARVLHLRTGKKIGYYTLVPAGILTALLRVAADKHWASDVITGMVIGSVAGYVIPTLHQE